MINERLIDQPTPAPTKKIQAAGVGGLIVAFVLGGLDALGAVDLPTLLDGLVPVASALLAGYFKRERSVSR